MRIMWISTATIVVVILGAMGINMFMHPKTGTGVTDFSSQSRTVQPK